MDASSAELITYFRGFIKINIGHVLCDMYNESRVCRYIQLFKADQCSREDLLHTIAVSITPEVLREAVLQYGSDINALYDPRNLPLLTLDSDTHLPCLQGQDLVEAARRYLPPGEKWWTVRLYSADIPEHLKQYLKESYSVLDESTDFDILQSLWLRANRSVAEWKAKTGTNYTYVRRTYENRELRHAIGALFPYAGLWDSFTLRKLDYVTGSHSYEEMVHYLQKIYQIWSIIPADVVDPISVKKIEGLMPAYSTSDWNQITSLMDDGSLFPRLVPDSQRITIKNHLLAVRGRVLSLRLFFSDAFLLNRVAQPLWKLSGKNSERSLRLSILGRWNSIAANKVLIQTSEVYFDNVALESVYSDIQKVDKSPWISYLQVWMAAFRHFIDPRRGKRGAEHGVQPLLKIQGILEVDYAAQKLGFGFCSTNSARYPAFQYVSRTLSNISGHIDPEKVRNIKDNFRRNFPESQDFSRARSSVVWSTDGETEKTTFRAGRPNVREYRILRQHFYLKDICDNLSAIHSHPTPVAVMREIFFDFFGRISWEVSSPIEFEPHPATPGDSVSVYSVASQVPYSSASQSINDGVSPQEVRPAHGAQALMPASGLTIALDNKPPWAAGFEDSDSIGPLEKECYITNRRSTTEILQLWHQHRDPGLVVFWLFHSKTYYKFRRDSVAALEDRIHYLASNHDFVSIYSNQVRAIPHNEILTEALDKALVLVAKKDAPSVQSRSGDDGQMTFQDLLRYVRNFDASTGKRLALEADGIVAEVPEANAPEAERQKRKKA